jgi:hypothetical protein
MSQGKVIIGLKPPLVRIYPPLPRALNVRVGFGRR